MVSNCWDELFNKGAVVGLSPMDGVTDAPMRYMTAKYGRGEISKQKFANSQIDADKGVQVIFTEFVSVDALRHAKNPESVDRLMKAFIRARDVGELAQQPYEVAQVFGHTPEYFYTAAVMVAELGYDGMDINMGCPAHKVEEHGSGAGLIRTPEVAKEIVRQAKRGIENWACGEVHLKDLEISPAVADWVREHRPKKLARKVIPVSVKTRIGVDSDVSEWWAKELMSVEPAVITIHGRTLKQMYQGEADWEAIGRAAKVVHDLGGHILGNGDIDTVESGKLKVTKYEVDGFLIGRAAEGNPGIFLESQNPNAHKSQMGVTWEQRKAWMLEHAEVYERVYGSDHFVPMRKHLAWYCKGFPGASEMRERLVRANSVEDVNKVLQNS